MEIPHTFFEKNQRPLSQTITRDFSRFGMRAEAINRLPDDFKQTLADGDITPILVWAMRIGNALTYLCARFKYVKGENGEAKLLSFPLRNLNKRTIEKECRKYTDDKEEIAMLGKGHVVIHGDGNLSNLETMLRQIDPVTGAMLSRSYSTVRLDERLAEIEKVNDISLSREQKERIRLCKPAELDVGGQKVTVGVDLRQPSGFRVIKGGMDDWEKQKERDYDYNNPGYCAIIQTDQNRWEYAEFLKNGQSIERMDTLTQRQAQQKTNDKSKGWKM